MKICFPTTNRVHLSRQKLLLEELAKDNEVVIADISHVAENETMANVAAAYAIEFNKYLERTKPDLVIIRGDRYEQLPLAMCCAYRQIPIAHIEGFDLSGVIDNRVRYAISYLSEFHFVTNDDSYKRAKNMGFKNVWNFGSLDCEYAMSVDGARTTKKPYLVVLYHPVPNERPEAILEALEAFKNDYDLIGIKSNHDYGKQLYSEEFSPDEFIRLLRGAKCLIGNSSAGIKEAGVLGTPVVNIGERQANRLRPKNVRDCKCETEDIKNAIEEQLKHGTYPISFLYYKPETSVKIAETIYNYLSKTKC